MVRKSRAERAEQYRSRAYRDMQTRLSASVLRLRRAKGLTQEECAHRCGMATRLFQRIESATANTTLTTLARLCEGLGVSPESLFAKRPR